MLSNKDIAQEIENVAAFFAKVNYPAQALHVDTKRYLDSFFRGTEFVALCNRIFGSYVALEAFPCSDSSWMERCDANPSSSLAVFLFNLIAPGSPFISLLEAFSTPMSTFSTQMRHSWKGSSASAGAHEDDALLYTHYMVDLPLETVMKNSYRLLSEPGEADLCSLSRAQCPALLAIPFWIPPLVARKECVLNQVVTSIPCTPLAYFILRLIIYLLRRVQRSDMTYLVAQSSRSILPPWIARYKDRLTNLMLPSPSRIFAFHEHIFCAFAQYYLTPALVSRLFSRKNLLNAVWSASDVSAALLIHLPFILSHREVIQPSDENRRVPCRESAVLASIVATVALLTEVYISLHHGSVRRSSRSFQASRERAISCRARLRDAACPMSEDVAYSDVALYRYCLITLRESLLAFDTLEGLRNSHLCNVLELWHTLLNPLWRVNEHVKRDYVLDHLEAYTYILFDVLNSLLFLGLTQKSIDATAVSVFTSCLDEMQQAASISVLRELLPCGPAAAARTAKCEGAFWIGKTTQAEMARRTFVLNWSRHDGSVALLNVFSTDVVDLAARVFLMFNEKMCDSSAECSTACLSSCQRAMRSLFPAFDESMERWQTMQCVATPARTSKALFAMPKVNFWSSLFRSGSGETSRPGLQETLSRGYRPLSAAEVHDFFTGRRATPNMWAEKTTNAAHVQYCGSHSSSIVSDKTISACRDEIPALASLAQLIDVIIAKVMDVVYANYIPSCDNGHAMWLRYSNDRSAPISCCRHLSEHGLWTCAMCELSYGSCCRALPVSERGAKLYVWRPHPAARPSHAETTCCALCGGFFADDELRYSTEEGEMYCCDCASRPFRQRSVRFIAAYRTWVLILAAFVLYYLLTIALLW